MPPMEDARSSEEKYNEILNSGMPHPACQPACFCRRMDLRSANLELEAAVVRGKSQSGFVTFRGIERTFRKTNFPSPQLALSSPIIFLSDMHIEPRVSVWFEWRD